MLTVAVVVTRAEGWRPTQPQIPMSREKQKERKVEEQNKGFKPTQFKFRRQQELVFYDSRKKQRRAFPFCICSLGIAWRRGEEYLAWDFLDGGDELENVWF